MAGKFGYGELPNTFQDAWICTANIAGATVSYTGAPIKIALVQMLDLDWVTENPELRGGGVLSRVGTILKGNTFTIRCGGIDIDAFNLMTGAKFGYSGAKGTEHNPGTRWRSYIELGRSGLPYFGLIAKSSTDDGGVFVLGLVAAKLDNPGKFSLNGETDDYAMSESAGRSISMPVESNGEPVSLVMRGYKAASNFTEPTTNTNFLSTFSTN